MHINDTYPSWYTFAFSMYYIAFMITKKNNGLNHLKLWASYSWGLFLTIPKKFSGERSGGWEPKNGRSLKTVSNAKVWSGHHISPCCQLHKYIFRMWAAKRVVWTSSTKVFVLTNCSYIIWYSMIGHSMHKRIVAVNWLAKGMQKKCSVYKSEIFSLLFSFHGSKQYPCSINQLMNRILCPIN